MPFEDRRNGTVDITGIVDYTGEIELIYRAGAVASVKAEIVYARDLFRFTTDMDRPEHAPDWFGDRGELIGAYAYAVMKDGATSKVVIYSKAEIDRVKAGVRAKHVRAVRRRRETSGTTEWPSKTVLHRLEHLVPTSAEYRREQLRAAAEISQQVNSAPRAVPAVIQRDASHHDVVDAELVTTPQTSPPRAGRISPALPIPHPPPAEPAGETLRQPDHDTPDAVMPSQLTAIWTILSTVYEFSKDEKDQARAVCAHILGHDLASTKDMSKTGAHHVLDTLSRWRATADKKNIPPRDYLLSVMAEGRRPAMSDECPIAAVFGASQHPCTLARGHDGQHEFTDDPQPWPDEVPDA